MPTTNEDLTAKFKAALREDTLLIELTRNLFGGQALIRLSKPGPSSRSKPVQLVPVIVADEGVKPSEHLRRIADAMQMEGR